MTAATKSGCEHCPADGGGCIACPTDTPVALTYRISIRIGRRWCVLDGTYTTREKAEAMVADWNDRGNVGTFRVEADGVA